jgi:hypothetical protein
LSLGLYCAGFLAGGGRIPFDEGKSPTGYKDWLNPRSSMSLLARISPTLANGSEADYVLSTGIDEPFADPTPSVIAEKKIFQVTKPGGHDA